MKESTLIDKFFKLTDELNNHNVEYKLKEKTNREIDNSDLIFLKQLIDKDAD